MTKVLYKTIAAAGDGRWDIFFKGMFILIWRTLKSDISFVAAFMSIIATIVIYFSGILYGGFTASLGLVLATFVVLYLLLFIVVGIGELVFWLMSMSMKSPGLAVNRLKSRIGHLSVSPRSIEDDVLKFEPRKRKEKRSPLAAEEQQDDEPEPDFVRRFYKSKASRRD